MIVNFDLLVLNLSFFYLDLIGYLLWIETFYLIFLVNEHCTVKPVKVYTSIMFTPVDSLHFFWVPAKSLYFMT